MSRLKAYYQLTKPGIIYGNAITAAAGFLLASRGRVNLGLLVATLAGISLVIAAACVFNNYLDRRIDALMARTKRRALVSGTVSPSHALTFAIVLNVLGFIILGAATNLLTVYVTIVGVVGYVGLYSIAKRRSVHGTIVGSISGAVPIVAGYTAVTNRFDTGAVLLFLILVLWQMPHFYAIAVYRFDDYAAAGLPVLPVAKGLRAAKLQMLVYITAFTLVALALTGLGYVGYTYLVAMTLLGLTWLWLAWQGLHTANDARWARQLFRFSLVVLLAFSLLISLAAVLR